MLNQCQVNFIAICFKTKKSEYSSETAVKRYKSPSFRDNETLLLLKLIEKYKYPLLIKSTAFSVNHTKDKAWVELTKEFNSLNTGYNYERTTDTLKTKWDNLKRQARKTSRSSIDPGDQLFHNEIVKTVITICEADVGPMLESDNNEETDGKEQKLRQGSFDSKDELKELDINADDSDGENRKSRPLSAFSARDCRLLLHCVRQEKNILFSNSPFARKQKVWCKIARSFNRQSPTKRSPPELRKKFQKLKAMASRVNNAKKCFMAAKSKKYEELNDETLSSKIKSEPKSDGTDDVDFDDDDDDNDSMEGPVSINNDSTHADDPLSNGVTASPIGLGSSNHSENKELDKLKMELLNYELETAKLQRKRIEEAIETEKRERDLRGLETSLRLRAARLEVLAAESKIPPLHPALIYTAEETRAQQYMTYRT